MSKPIYLVLLLVLFASGCASTSTLTNDPKDPWEGFNRGVHGFNHTLDTALLKPVAQGYRYVAPEFVEQGVTNFFSNLGDVTVAFNNTLQFKFLNAASDLGRIVVNSTIGLLGFIDVASVIGLEKHNEDFGQTLGYWGVGTGPYLVLPFLGPSNLRDGPSRIVDTLTYPPTWADIKVVERNALFITNAVSDRANLLDLEERAAEFSRDRYVFLRDAYLDNRKFLVDDGEITADDSLYEGLEDE